MEYSASSNQNKASQDDYEWSQDDGDVSHMSFQHHEQDGLHDHQYEEKWREDGNNEIRIQIDECHFLL
jgi:hypothetical protein